MGDILVKGDKLIAGQSRTSLNGKHKFYMGRNGYATLFRFEAGQHPIVMWRFKCFHPRKDGECWLEVNAFDGSLMGAEMRNNKPTYWWIVPLDAGSHPPGDTILRVNDDGNVVLYSKDAQGNHSIGEWDTRTHGSYPASINCDLNTGLVMAGTIAVSNANTIIENTLSDAINVSDGRVAVVLNPGDTVAMHSPLGPGVVAIGFANTSYDLEKGEADAGAPPPITTASTGNLVRLVRGQPSPFEWSVGERRNFSHLQMPGELDSRNQGGEEKGQVSMSNSESPLG